MSATRVTASVIAVLAALTSVVHGYREILYGNVPTPGRLLVAVGAFTLIPNYLATGIATVAVSLGIIVWTIGFLGSRRGALVLLVLVIALFLVGGGFAHVVAFALACAMATRIGKPLTWWSCVLPGGWRGALSRLWPSLFAISLLSLGLGIAIWLLGGVPAVGDPVQSVHLTWALLLVGLVALLVTVVAAFARDIESRAAPARDHVVRLVEPDSADFVALVAALDAELDARYPGLSADAPPPAHDLLVAVVAYGGDTPLGCGALRELEPGVGEVKRMYVLPEARGLGVARGMLEALESRARALSYPVVRLGSGVRQPEALALYESSGYRRIPLFGEYEGADLCVCYEKSLG